MRKEKRGRRSREVEVEEIEEVHTENVGGKESKTEGTVGESKIGKR